MHVIACSFLVVWALSLCSVHAFTSSVPNLALRSCLMSSYQSSRDQGSSQRNNQYQYISISHQCRPPTNLSALSTGVASLLAGSVGGAIGVGVAYPFDTIKTKAQVYNVQRQQLQQSTQENELLASFNQNEYAPSEMVHPPNSPTYIPLESPDDNLISLIRLILKLEGISGFFGGVRAMMIGQALIKSVAFSANELALDILNHNLSDKSADVSFGTLLVAASFSGFVTSFLVAPVGKILLR